MAYPMGSCSLPPKRLVYIQSEGGDEMSSDQTATVVVAAAIVQDGKVLLRQKKETRIPENVGVWELPGGIVHYGEPFDAALRREIKEELNLEISVGKLLHSQINTYSTGVDYLVLYYVCTLTGGVSFLPGAGSGFFEPSGLGTAQAIFGILPGTAEAVGKLVSEFSFVQADVTDQTPDETLHVMTYELGRLVEHHHKGKRYGEQGYLGSAKKELAGLVSMCRMYCEQRGWDFDELMKLGEEDYLERMDDLRKHSIAERCTECGRTLPIHNPECSQNEKMY